MANIMTVRAPEDLKKILKDIAQKKGMPRNSLVLQILWEWAEKNNVE